MKRLIKKNLTNIVIFMFLLTILLINTGNYIVNHQNLLKRETEIRNSCEILVYETKDEEEKCELIRNTPEYKIDFYSMLYSVFTQGFSKVTLIFFLLITIVPIYTVCKFLKNNMLKNYLTRKSYKKIILDLFLKASKSLLILPTIAIIAFIICMLYTKNFDYQNAVDAGFVAWKIESLKNPILFMLIYIIRLLVISTLYMNIALIVCKKNHNFFTSTILSYLAFCAIEIVLEVIVNMIIFNIIFKSSFGTLFNIVSTLSLFDYYGLCYSILIPIFLMTISIFILAKTYSSKEQLLIECEKNN